MILLNVGHQNSLGSTNTGYKFKILKTHNKIQCGLNEYLQSMMDSTANATLPLILNKYVQF